MAYRKEKLEEQIRRIISEILVKEVNDPRIGFTTITGVNLNKDLSIARVGISVIGDPKARRKALDGLRSAKGFIQKNVGKNLRIKNIPRIEFELDSSVSDGVQMVNLLENLEGVKGKNDTDEEEEFRSQEPDDSGQTP
ncbi:MAG: 30S ribosome-binding factor RbfA [bacterium]|nr:30S ribosome-binding factor RbfA [bacterium]